MLTFEYPDGDAEFIVGGLASASPAIYELTNKRREHRRSEPRPCDRRNGERRRAVFGSVPRGQRPGAYGRDAAPVRGGRLRRDRVGRRPDFSTDTVSDLKNNANQADMIVIANPTVLDVVSGPTLTSS